MTSQITGYVLLHRQIQDNPDYFSEPFTRIQAWIDLILLANSNKGFIYVRGNQVEIPRGCVGWSKERLSDRWQWSRKKVTKFLDDLEKRGQICQKKAQQNAQQKSRLLSTILIVNYDYWQSNGTTECTTEEQQKNNRSPLTNNNIHEINNINLKKDTYVSKKEEAIDYNYFLNTWNDLGLNQLRAITSQRKEKIKARLKNDRDFQVHFKIAVEKIRESSFCNGQNENKWKATFEWLVKNDTNYVKVLEDKYANKSENLTMEDFESVFG